ncbi:sestrin-like protein [Planoprotostelium fungivorum]|uniref:Sestrin-like protein n=1 Tax=Planoprotostelium fungivorum TaxID=1890364 RepID=A0A2P6NL48_9EUKA|nr:sestrin-like protein [Planoprotostelium fungivorum]
MSEHDEDLSYEFFRPMFEPDEKLRAEATKSIIDQLKESLDSPDKVLVKTHLARIVRFSREVPFDDITSAFSDLLRQIEKNGEFPTIPKILVPSSFIPKSEFPAVNTTDPKLRNIFGEIFYTTGRVSHLNRIIALHSTYFERYYEAYNFIMREPGPLPLSWRNYIAILSSARHRCRWLINVQETEFLANDGDPEWLKGVDFLPKKMQALLDINQIMNHQPWLITKEHIAHLVKGDDSWSIGELVHAMIIMVTFKAMAGIVFGCGVTNEVDFPDDNNSAIEASEDEDVEGQIQSATDKVAELLREGNWIQDDAHDAQVTHFMNAESAEDSHATSKRRYMSDSHINKFIGRNHTMQHEDFDCKAKKIFRVQDYGWKEDGFELARRFLPGAATLLDEEFDHIYTLTYHEFDQNTNVDTFPFRQAIWQYVQRVQGIFHDDYDYQQTKGFVKRLVCYTEEIVKSDYKNLGLKRHSEKVHAIVLAVASSKQSELLYGLHAVVDRMETEGETQTKRRKTSVEDAEKEVFIISSDDSDKEPEVERCPICLCPPENLAMADQCFHTFCFFCILQWSKAGDQPRCPLCKREFFSLIYQVKSNTEYKRHFLEQDSPPSKKRLPNRLVREYNRWGRSAPAAPLDLSSSSNIPFSTEHSLRRAVYTRHLRSIPLVSFVGDPKSQVKTVRVSTPKFDHKEYAKNTEKWKAKLKPWITRELQSMLLVEDVEIIVVFIFCLLERCDVDSPQAKEKLKDYLKEHVDTFAHELIQFANAPYEMNVYDKKVQYDYSSAKPSTATEIIELSDDENEEEEDGEERRSHLSDDYTRLKRELSQTDGRLLSLHRQLANLEKIIIREKEELQKKISSNET